MSALSAPSQTIKGINEFDNNRQNILTDNRGSLQIRSFEIEELLKEILNQLCLIRQNIEIISD